MENELKLEDLGYDPFFEDSRIELGLGGFPVARVIAEHKGGYEVKDAGGEYRAVVTGRLMHEALSREDYPAVGDWVAVNKQASEAVIRGVLPRRTLMTRKSGNKNAEGEKTKTQIIAANVDEAFIVESVDRDYSLNRFERYFVIVRNGGVSPVIVLNKIDLIAQREAEEMAGELKDRFPGAHLIVTSTVNKEGLDALKGYVRKGRTYCFLGSSGVGKSSLINALLGEQAVRTGEISRYSGRGKHVTTGRQMHFLKSGGMVIDNPGTREVGVAGASNGVESVTGAVSALAPFCRYADCTHTHEPDCEVLKAVESGELSREQYDNYLNMKKESDHYEMSDYEKRNQDRQFGKFMKRTKKQFKDLGHRGY